MATKTQTSSSGISFVGLLTIVFITLKLCGVINWSWVWVLSPIWICAGIICFVLAIVLVVLGFIAWFSK